MDKVDYEAKLAAEVEKLRKYQADLAAEYTQTVADAADGSPELIPADVIKRANARLLNTVDKAVDCIVHLVEHADKDATRFAVAKYVIDRVGANPDSKGETLDELLKKLTAGNDTT
jgi:hypothetical protein